MEKKTRVLLLLLGVVVLLFGAFSYAARKRNLALEETDAYCTLCALGPEAKHASLQGAVTGITIPKSRKKDIVCLTVTDGRQSITVRTAPLAYLQAVQLSVQSGAQVEVYGWEMTENGTPYIVAREIRTNGRHYILRTPNGKPNYWDQVMKR